MGEEELVLRASMKDELSAPLADVRGNVRGLGSDLSSTGRHGKLASLGLGAMSRAGRILKGTMIGAAAGVAAVGVAAYKLGKSAIQQASDLGESINAVNVSYGKYAKGVLKLSKGAADGLGLSRSQFNSFSVQFSSFAETIAGKNKGEIVGVVDEMTTRIADFASVMNLTVPEAAEKFQSALAGETEPMKKYGVDVSAATVETYALSVGMIKAGETMTEQQKIQARYGWIMKDTAKVAGDFKNTQDEVANAQRRLSARWDDAQAKLGKALLPMMKVVVGYLMKEGIPAFNRFSRWFTEKGLPAIASFVDKAWPKIKSFFAKMKPLAQEVLPLVWGGLKKVASWAESAAGYATDMVVAFKGMPAWARNAIIGAGVGAAVLPRIQRSGPGKLLGSGAGIQKVFVTNPGFGKGGPGVVPTGRDGKPEPVRPKPSKAPKLGLMAVLAGIVGTGGKTGDLEKIIGDPLGQLKKELMFGFSKEGQASLHGLPDWAKPFGAAGFVPDAPKEARSGPKVASAEDRAAITDLGKRTEYAADATRNLNSRFKDLQLAAGNGKAEVKGLTTGLGDLGSQHPKPKVSVTGIPESTSHVDGFIRGPLKNVQKPVSAHVGADTSAALGKVDYLARMIAGLSRTVTVDLTPRGMGARERGGPVARGQAYLVGEKRPELFVPESNGRIIPRVPTGQGGGETASAGRTLVLERGAIEINNPAQHLDIVDAIAEGIEKYEREREERK